MQEYFNLFNNYVKTFDLKDKMIRLKFHHTYRVMEYATLIADSIGADKFKAKLCALFHDIGRFEQWKNYGTFKDYESIDHGELGYRIINELFANIPYKDLIQFTIKNHNKIEIEKTNNQEYLLYTKIIRDADKLDIMIEQLNKITDSSFEVKKEIIDAILKGELIKNNLITNEVDSIFRIMSFIYDINFKYTFEMILDKKIIENKIHLLECYIDYDLKEIKNYLIGYINKKVED